MMFIHSAIAVRASDGLTVDMVRDYGYEPRSTAVIALSDLAKDGDATVYATIDYTDHNGRGATTLVINYTHKDGLLYAKVKRARPGELPHEYELVYGCERWFSANLDTDSEQVGTPLDDFAQLALFRTSDGYVTKVRTMSGWEIYHA